MSDKLENYVRNNRAEFDLHEPGTEIWNKLEQRLSPNVKKGNFSFLWKAAAILIIFGFSFWAQMQLEQTPPLVNQPTIQNHSEIASAPETPEIVESPTELNSVLPEFAETEKYYSRKVKSTMKELKVYLVKYPDVASDMKKDIAELDSVYKTLKRDLGDNVAHEEILSAMIQNYRMKLQILQDIKSELMQNSTVKSTTKRNSHDI